MTEKVYQIFTDGRPPEIIEEVPIEGRVIDSSRDDPGFEGKKIDGVFLDIDTDRIFSYIISGYLNNVPIGKRVRLFPIDPGTREWQLKSDLRSVAVMQLLNEDGTVEYTHVNKFYEFRQA